MHSDLTQEKREEVMKNFKSGNIDLLVAPTSWPAVSISTTSAW